MGALGVVELERSSQRVEHAVGDPIRIAALQAGVVRNAHAGQNGDLLAAQPGNAATAVGAQTHERRRAIRSLSRHVACLGLR